MYSVESLLGIYQDCSTGEFLEKLEFACRSRGRSLQSICEEIGWMYVEDNELAEADVQWAAEAIEDGGREVSSVDIVRRLNIEAKAAGRNLRIQYLLRCTKAAHLIFRGRPIERA